MNLSRELVLEGLRHSMEKDLISSFRFIDYKIENLNFKLNSKYDGFKDRAEEIELDLSLSVKIELAEDNSDAKIRLHMDIFKDAEIKNYPYSILLDMVGYFEIEGDCLEEALTFCKINGTAVMFPYMRAAVTDLTKISNSDSLTLPLINIQKLLEREEKK